jgi:hypothetical protein
MDATVHSFPFVRPADHVPSLPSTAPDSAHTCKNGLQSAAVRRERKGNDQRRLEAALNTFKGKMCSLSTSYHGIAHMFCQPQILQLYDDNLYSFMPITVHKLGSQAGVGSVNVSNDLLSSTQHSICTYALIQQTMQTIIKLASPIDYS